MITYKVTVDDDGTTRWYINRLLHREDGPAVEHANGYKAWFINGKLHREDGPAVEYANAYKAWWINGQELTEQEFLQHTQPVVKELTIAELENHFGCKIKIIKE